MSPLLSARAGFDRLGYGRFALAWALAWAAPAALGLLALGLFAALGAATWGAGWLLAHALAMMALWSPVFTLIGLTLTTPLAAILMNRGWFGAMPALLLGMGAGAASDWYLGEVLLTGLMATQLLGARAIAGRLAPGLLSPEG